MDSVSDPALAVRARADRPRVPRTARALAPRGSSGSVPVHSFRARDQRGHRAAARVREGRRADRRRRDALQPDRVPRARPGRDVVDVRHAPEGGEILIDAKGVSRSSAARSGSGRWSRSRLAGLAAIVVAIVASPGLRHFIGSAQPADPRPARPRLARAPCRPTPPAELLAPLEDVWCFLAGAEPPLRTGGRALPRVSPTAAASRRGARWKLHAPTRPRSCAGRLSESTLIGSSRSSRRTAFAWHMIVERARTSSCSSSTPATTHAIVELDVDRGRSSRPARSLPPQGAHPLYALVPDCRGA